MKTFGSCHLIINRNPMMIIDKLVTLYMLIFLGREGEGALWFYVYSSSLLIGWWAQQTTIVQIQQVVGYMLPWRSCGSIVAVQQSMAYGNEIKMGVCQLQWICCGWHREHEWQKVQLNGGVSPGIYSDFFSPTDSVTFESNGSIDMNSNRRWYNG